MKFTSFKIFFGIFHNNSMSTPLSQDNPYHSLHLLFRLLQRRNRFVYRTLGTNLNLAEGIALVEIGSRNGITPGDLATLINLSRPDISRMLKHLENRKLIQKQNSNQDGRTYSVILSKLGYKALQGLDDSVEGNYTKIFMDYTKSEIDSFTFYMQKLNDGLGAPPATIREGECPPRPELRRYAVVQKLNSKIHFSNISINSLHWHIISEIYESNQAMTSSKLALLLGAPRNTISQAVDSLKNSGFVSKVKSSLDARSTIISLTKRGVDYYIELRNNSSVRFQDALKELNSEQIHEFVYLLSRTVQLPANNDDVVIAPQVRIKRYQTPEDRNELRQFYLKTLIKSGEPSTLNEVMFGANNLCFGLLLDGTLSCSLEIVPEESGGNLQNMIRSPEVDKNFLTQLINHSTNYFSNLYPGFKIKKTSLAQHADRSSA